LYVFTLTGEEVLAVAGISHVGRSEQGKLFGYQRPEVRRHIRNITEYLDSDDVLLPNSLVVALSPEVHFRAMRGPHGGDSYASVGTIEIPIPTSGGPKPGFIVDGQQRAVALSRSRRTAFPVVINAFVADHASVQREQFLRVNSTKPLPRGLITELLPEVDGVLPSHLAKRRVPSALCDVLNTDPISPFRGIISRSSMAKRDRRSGAVVADTAIVQMIHDSLVSPKGCLFTYRNTATGMVDVLGSRTILFTFWDAVRSEFGDAWGLPPTRSRLMHGAGIRAMGRVMDYVMKGVGPIDSRAATRVRREIAALRPVARWTGGTWDILNGMKWNEIQNIPSHVKALGDALVRTYLQIRNVS
jgi:DGQHR domain-containing protein